MRRVMRRLIIIILIVVLVVDQNILGMFFDSVLFPAKVQAEMNYNNEEKSKEDTKQTAMNIVETDTEPPEMDSMKVDTEQVTPKTLPDKEIKELTTEPPEVNVSEKPSQKKQSLQKSAVGAGKTEIPTTLQELEAGSTTNYILNSDEDLQRFQTISQLSSLEGYTFTFLSNRDTSDGSWNIAGQSWFEGIGTQDTPFKGRIEGYIDEGVIYKINKPLFKYLSTGAVIYNFTFSITSNNQGHAALADTVIKSSADTATDIKIEKVEIQGSINLTGTGVAGGIFAEVRNTHTSSPINITIDNVNAVKINASIQAYTAGGMIGKTSGLVNIYCGEAINIAGSVTGINDLGTAGGIIGELGANGSFVLTANKKIVNTIGGIGINGGLIGTANQAVIKSTGDIIKQGNVTGSRNAGGIIGKSVDSEVTLKNITIDSGVIYCTNETVTTYDGTAGGIIGLYSGNKKAEIDNITIKGSSSSVTIRGYHAGGVIGYIKNGNNVLLNSAVVENVAISNGYTGMAGGIVGALQGKNIEFNDITINQATSNIMKGLQRGGIIGTLVDPLTEYNTVRLKNIDVRLQYTGAYVSGGVVGNVPRHSLLGLGGDVKITILAAAGLGTHASRGYIVGQQVASVIYFDIGATADIAINGKQITDASADMYDLVGTYGGVYQNYEDNGVALFDFNSQNDQYVTGTVEKDGSGNFILKNKCDFIRLAIALNTGDKGAIISPFAADCFDNTTVDNLRAANYKIVNDVDLRGTGILALSRNDKTTDADRKAYAFKGTFKGDGVEQKTIIRDDTYTMQSYIGLFPYTDGAKFSNIHVKGNINYAKVAGGIVSNAYNDLTLDKVSASVNIYAYPKDYAWGGGNYYYGGMVGYYVIGGNLLNANDIVLSTEINNIRRGCIAGGMIGAMQTASGSKVNLTNITIGGNIASHATYFSGTETASTLYGRCGGLIAAICHNSITNGSAYSYTLENYSLNTTYCTITADQIKVKNQSINTTASNGTFMNTGGLLGQDWINVDADFRHVSVEDSDLNVKGEFGGLFRCVSGRLKLADVNISNSSFNGKSAPSNCSLLVQNGKNLLMMLEDYKIEDTVSVSDVQKDSFDEIVGISKDGNYGGIITMKQEKFADMVTSSGTYQSYQNQLSTTMKNSDSRYYYNLFDDEWISEADSGYIKEWSQAMVENNILDTPAKVMAWNVSQNASSNILRFITPYFDNPNVVRNGDFTFKGTLDLGGYSYYPTTITKGTYTGVDDAVIILYGDLLDTLEATNKQPSQTMLEHYGMHAGIFYNASDVTVDNICLKGSVTNLGTKSGTLMAGTLTGNVDIKNIVLDNIHITNYNGEEGAYGLLISEVGDDSNVNLSHISMDNYNDDRPAAAALIGTVGSANAKNCKIYFEKIKVPDEKANSVLSFASFIYYYDYTSNADEYLGRGIYIFTEEDYNGDMVTFGQELQYGVEFWDNTSRPVTEINNARSNLYKPYVYSPTTRMISINPKSGDLKQGCGTYEDPYVISSAIQIDTLYCYLTGSTGYNSYFTDWKITPIGDNDSICTDVHTSGEAVLYGTPNFPTRDELRKAYYIINNNINLDEPSSLNEYIIANDFSGLGSSDYPFAGVIIGQDHTITLPGNKENSKYALGFIQYMKGGVIKDITIAGGEQLGVVDSENLYITDYCGGVAAIILGGDNIIDNVTVKTGFEAKQDDANMGGYVGCIKKGSLIIRNLVASNLEDCNLVCNIDAQSHMDFNLLRISRAVGWVEDGYIIYEGSSNRTSEILTNTDFGFEESDMQLSQTFPFINKSYLEDHTASSKIKVTGVGNENYAQIHNGAQLEIMAIALNSDSFSIVSYDANNRASNYRYGYDQFAVCRKGDYSYVGNVNSANTSSMNAYQTVVEEDDDVYYNPYVYQFIDFTSMEDRNMDGINDYKDILYSSSDGYISVMNKVNTQVANYTTNYSLEANGIAYDLSGYKRSFRGIGATYNTLCSEFKANFDGSNQTIIAEMLQDYNEKIPTIGLFNDLNYYAGAGNTLSIGNFQLEGSFKNTVAASVSNDQSHCHAGAVAGQIYGNWNFYNITLDEVTVEGKGLSGGIIGRIAYGNGTTKYNYTFTSCAMNDTIVSSTLSGDVGGLIGRVGYSVDITTVAYHWYGDITVKDCSADQLTVTAKSGSSGGLIGQIGRSNTSYISNTKIISSDGTQNVLKNMDISGTLCTGGVIGDYCPRYNSNILEVSNVTVQDSKVSTTGATAYGMGGLCGRIYSGVTTNDVFTFNDNNVKNTVLNSDKKDYIGGFVGRVEAGYNIKVLNGSVIDSVINGTGVYEGGIIGYTNSYYCIVAGSDTENIVISNLEITGGTTYSGGIIGGNNTASRDSRISYIDISGLKIKMTAVTAVNAAAAGVWGYIYSANGAYKNVFNNITIRDTQLWGRYAGGMAGYACRIGDSNQQEVSDVLVDNCQIFGMSAGGLIAVDAIRGSYHNIVVKNSYIAAYVAATTVIAAGGVVGSKDFYANSYYSDLTVKNNVIVTYNTARTTRTGGILGEIRSGTAGREVYIYNAKLKDNVIGFAPTLQSTGANLTSLTDDPANIKLISSSSVAVNPPDNLKENQIKDYAYRIGNLIGYASKNAGTYVLRPTVVYTDSFTGTRPVVDFGSGAIATEDGSLYSYPYDYRKECHAIYFEPDNIPAYAEDIIAGQAEDEYVYGNIETIIDAYKKIGEQPSDYTKDELLNAYRLNITNDNSKTLLDIYHECYQDVDGAYISDFKDKNDNIIPILIYDAQYGTANDTVNGFINILTNAGGTLSSSVKPTIKSVETLAARINLDGTIEYLPNENASLAVGSDGYSISYKAFDKTTNQGTTISVVAVTYGWASYTVNGTTITPEETIYIPIYVVERLEVNSIVRMAEGAEYSLETLQSKNEATNILMANDTTYTIYSEYLYGSARIKYKDIQVQKTFKLETMGANDEYVAKVIAKGTRLTLVDLDTGIPYYYTVTNESITEIDFVDFKDALGQPYKLRKMEQVSTLTDYNAIDGNTYEDVGRERYIIVVDCSKVDDKKKEIYRLSISPYNTKEVSRMDIELAEPIIITSVAGLNITLENEGTSVTGEINQGEEVTINARFSITAPKLEGQTEGVGPYWILAANGMIIDSSNNGKFLELAIYLENESGRIPLPSNTNIRMDGKDPFAVTNKSVIYYYKDSESAYQMDDLKQDTYQDHQITLNFSVADLLEYNNEAYTVHIELLRTNEVKYPMGGDLLGEYFGSVPTTYHKDMAVAVEADMMSLGINTYQETKHTYEIPFTSKFDFSGLIVSMRDDTVIIRDNEVKDLAEKEYQVTYRLFKKVYLDEETGAKRRKYKYEQLTEEDRLTLYEKKDASSDDWEQMPAQNINGEYVYQKTLTFTKDEIRDGTSGVIGLVTRDLKLMVDTEELDDIDLSNYKLEMTLIPHDVGIEVNPNSGLTITLTDYFIFTIAKLVTGM